MVLWHKSGMEVFLAQRLFFINPYVTLLGVCVCKQVLLRPPNDLDLRPLIQSFINIALLRPLICALVIFKYMLMRFYGI